MTAGTRILELPGRLGDPSRSLSEDRRADPRMLAAMAALGLDRDPDPLPVSASSSREDLLAFVAAAEQGFQAAFGALLADVDPVARVWRDTMTVAGEGGHRIGLTVHRPTIGGGNLPCVVHLHGGGGVILTAGEPCYVHWRDALAARGMTVIGVEFRNAGGALGPNPYPSGLEDCAAAVRWVAAHRGELSVSSVIVSGESGGGNLSLAVALKAAREGWAHEIAGVYAMAPQIASPWDRPAELPSQSENDGYFISCDLLAVMGAVYDSGGRHAEDPLCWPSRASDGELRALPPHVISVNELDPLRDEGIAYQRRLVANGVSAVGRTVNGTVHGAEVFFPGAIPDICAATVRDIHAFATSR
jgi:acetyl esterase